MCTVAVIVKVKNIIEIQLIRSTRQKGDVQLHGEPAHRVYKTYRLFIKNLQVLDLNLYKTQTYLNIDELLIIFFGVVAYKLRMLRTILTLIYLQSFCVSVCRFF
jgi:hypothetical protein